MRYLIFLITSVYSLKLSVSFSPPVYTIPSEYCFYSTRWSNSTYNKLEIKLFCDNKEDRAGNDTIYVDLNFHPTHIDVEEDDEMMKLEGHMILTWVNKALMWNLSAFENIKQVQGGDYYYRMWTPTIETLDESLHRGYDMDVIYGSQKYVTIRYDGTVTVYTSVSLNGFCVQDNAKWPYDKLNCSLAIGNGDSDNNPNANFEFKNFPKVELDNLKNNRKYDVKGVTVNHVNVTRYKNSPPLELTRISILIARHTYIYSMIYVSPGILLGILSLIPFWMSNCIGLRFKINTVTILLQMIFLIELFAVVYQNGPNEIKIVSFYRNCTYISFIGILLTLLRYKISTTPGNPPNIITDLFSVLVSLPYIGWVSSCLMGEQERQESFDNDEISLIKTSDIFNPKWTKVFNMLDRCMFFVIFIYLLYLWATILS